MDYDGSMQSLSMIIQLSTCNAVWWVVVIYFCIFLGGGLACARTPPEEEFGTLPCRGSG